MNLKGNSKIPSLKQQENNPNSKKLLQEFSQLIPKCKIPINFELRSFPVETSDYKHFEYLLELTTKPNIFDNLSDDFVISLIDLCLFHILHNEVQLSDKFLYYEIKVFYITGWIQLSCIHELFIFLISFLPLQHFNQILDQNLILKLIRLTCSPDFRETNSLEIIISIIYDRFPSLRHFIISNFLKNITYQITSISNFFSIQPALRFFLLFFKDFQGEWKEEFNFIYLQKFLPLFKSHFFVDFYSILSSISVIFYRHCLSLSYSTLLYMFKHWPKTNSLKISLFLRHFSTISFPISTLDSVDDVIIKMFEKINDCLHSNNFTIVMAALDLTFDIDFLILFEDFFPKILNNLIVNVKLLHDHWNCECRAFAHEVFEFLLSMKLYDTSFENYEKQEHESEARQFKWDQILMFAQQNDSSIHFNNNCYNIFF